MCPSVPDGVPTSAQKSHCAGDHLDSLGRGRALRMQQGNKKPLRPEHRATALLPGGRARSRFTGSLPTTIRQIPTEAASESADEVAGELAATPARISTGNWRSKGWLRKRIRRKRIRTRIRGRTRVRTQVRLQRRLQAVLQATDYRRLQARVLEVLQEQDPVRNG